MANNPYVNKVQFGNETLIDLTSDTVTPDKVLNGVTFHDKSGALQTGTLTPMSSKFTYANNRLTLNVP